MSYPCWWIIFRRWLGNKHFYFIFNFFFSKNTNFSRFLPRKLPSLIFPIILNNNNKQVSGGDSSWRYHKFYRWSKSIISKAKMRKLCDESMKSSPLENFIIFGCKEFETFQVFHSEVHCTFEMKNPVFKKLKARQFPRQRMFLHHVCVVWMREASKSFKSNPRSFHFNKFFMTHQSFRWKPSIKPIKLFQFIQSSRLVMLRVCCFPPLLFLWGIHTNR